MDLVIDVVYINSEVFLHTVDCMIKCSSRIVLGTYTKGQAPTKEILFKAIDEVLQKYNQCEVSIKTIHADNGFWSVFTNLVDNWDIEINFSNPGKHVLDIKRGNQTLQERFWVQLYQLPFKVMPRTMIQYLPSRITKNQSVFPYQSILAPMCS